MCVKSDKSFIGVVMDNRIVCECSYRISANLRDEELDLPSLL